MTETETHDVRLDEDLSALLDGELAPEREAELRARIAEAPALAARLTELERVDAGLRALPTTEASPALRDGLRAKLEAEGRGAADDVPSLDARRRVARGWIGAALAAAAALVLYLAVPGRGPVEVPDSRPAADALAEATDEEIGIALDYETLADLDVIEDLELLELMVELEEEEAGRG